MNPARHPMPLLLVALSFAGTLPATAAEAPGAAVAAIRRAAPAKVDPAKIEREERGDGEAFEYGWKADGAEHEVVVTADGQLLVEEHQIDPATLPARILAALKKQGLTATAAERVRVEAFEVEVRRTGEAMEKKEEADDDAEDAEEDAKERFFLPDGVAVSEGWLMGRGGGEEHEDEEGENEEGMEVRLDQLPAAVRTTLERVLPDFDAEEAEREGRGEEARYEVKGEADGHDYEVKLDGSGGLLSLERDNED